MRTRVVNIRSDAYDIDVSRSGPFGNPFRMHFGRGGSRKDVIKKHILWLEQWTLHKKEVIIHGYSNKWVIEHVHELKGKRIACFCAPSACHGDTLAKLANNA